MNGTSTAALRKFNALGNGFRASRVILTANNLGVFEALRKARTAGETARALRTNVRATEILLDAVTAIGLLKKNGNRYRNAPLATNFLISTSPSYQGDMLSHADALWKNWSNLDEVVRTGIPSRSGGRDHNVFIRAMHNNALPRVRQVLSALDLRQVQTALDLGGGPGTYSIALAKQGIAVTLFDVPETLATARKIARAAGAKGIVFRGGDFTADDIGGPYDLVLLSQILHSHGPRENQTLLAKAAAALAPGGTVAVHEFRLDENRAGPAPGALFSVNMLVNTPAGRSYTPKEIRGWMNKAGLRRLQIRQLEDTVVVSGQRPPA